jgi:hypothetical protein
MGEPCRIVDELRDAPWVVLAAYLVPDGRSMMEYARLDEDSLVVRNVRPALSARLLTLISWLGRRAWGRRLRAHALPSSMRTHVIVPEVCREALYHDCPDDISERAKVLLEREPNWAGLRRHVSPTRASDASQRPISSAREIAP